MNKRSTATFVARLGVGLGIVLGLLLDLQVYGRKTCDMRYVGVVSILRKDVGDSYLYRCGASHIGDGWILTAKHCVTGADGHYCSGYRDYLRVGFGAFDRSCQQPLVPCVCQEYTGADLALLRVVPNGSWELPRVGVPAPLKARVSFVGWGEGGWQGDVFTDSERLREGEGTVVDDSVCMGPVPGFDVATDMCIDSLESSSSGDSGGPVLSGSDIAGVIKNSKPCSVFKVKCRGKIAAVRVQPVNNWICSKMGRADCPSATP